MPSLVTCSPLSLFSPASIVLSPRDPLQYGHHSTPMICHSPITGRFLSVCITGSGVLPDVPVHRILRPTLGTYRSSLLHQDNNTSCQHRKIRLFGAQHQGRWALYGVIMAAHMPTVDSVCLRPRHICVCKCTLRSTFNQNPLPHSLKPGDWNGQL